MLRRGRRRLGRAIISVCLLGAMAIIDGATTPGVVPVTLSSRAVALAAGTTPPSSAHSGSLWTFAGTAGSAGQGTPASLGMAAGTSPSITSLPNGQVAVAFQANTGALWTWSGTPGSTGTGASTDLGMAAGTSPSITLLPNGQVAVAFQANTGALWTWSGTPGTTGYGVSASLGMAAETSPSIISLSNGQVAVAFQANTGALWTWSGAPGTAGRSATSAGLGMLGGTGPGIASLSNGQVAVAFQANTGGLWTWSGAPGTTGHAATPAGLGMAAGTSPGIASLSNGQVAVAFQANTGALWTWSGAPGTAGRSATSAGLGMLGGTGPGIASLSNGQVAVAFIANTGSPWTWSGAPGTAGRSATSAGLGMLGGASPGIASLSNGQIAAAFEAITGTGVYGCSTATSCQTMVQAAIAGGWAGVGSVSGICPSPSTTYACPTGADQSLEQSGEGTFWLSFWTVGAPVNCDFSASGWYADGQTAGTTAATELIGIGGARLPDYEILDPEGFGGAPSSSPWTSHCPNAQSNCSAASVNTCWASWLNGWKAGLTGASPRMYPAFYTSQSPMRDYGLLSLGMPAFPAVAPILGNTPFVTGPPVTGYIAYTAQCPADKYAVQAGSWGAQYNTVQFGDSAVDCAA